MNKPLSEMTLGELGMLRAQLQDYINQAVVQARRGGSTWAAIGSSLMVSPSEAHRRYHWLEKYSSPSSPNETT